MVTSLLELQWDRQTDGQTGGQRVRRSAMCSVGVRIINVRISV